MPAGYYTLAVPPLLRTEARNLSVARRAELERFTTACRTVEDFSGMVHNLFDRILPRAQEEQAGRAQTLEALLETHGFDRVQHERIQSDLRSGRIGLAQNRLPVTSRIEDAEPDYLDARHRELGLQALAEGRVAVGSLAREKNYHYPGTLVLSPGRIIGLRMVPMERDLRFAWEEMPQQMLDEQAQK